MTSTWDPREVFGPGLGDRIHLADTGLVIEIETDDRGDTLTGTGFVVGFGRTGRDGIGMQAVRTSQSCDVAVTNVVLLDPVLGVRVTTIGIREGRVVAIGRAGNPDTTDGIEVVIGTGTVVVPGEGLIATPGGVDSHVHLLSPRVCEAELASGVTTVIGQEIGPFWGVGVGSAWALRTGYPAFDAYPLNVGLLGRGSSSQVDPLLEALEAGAVGFKVHEDTGAQPRTLDTALRVADSYDVQVALHTDGLNESGTVADTIAVVAGRTVHAYHVEGSGGGHVPDVLTLASAPGVLASSTNPTLPFGRDAVTEQLGLIAYSHGLSTAVPGDRAIAADRVRAGTMGAENLLHDLGVIPITSSDAQGMGRAGETWSRTFALAGLCAARDGVPPGDPHRAQTGLGRGGDNERVLRYLAKITINPAVAHGLSHEVGTLAPGHLADIVLWRPARFAVSPELVLKSGLPAWGATGDPNAAIDAAQPIVLARQFGGTGAMPAELAVQFVNTAAAEAGTVGSRTRRRLVAVRDCRDLDPARAMLRHGVRGTIDVTPSGRVSLDGVELRLDPADRVPLARLYRL